LVYRHSGAAWSTAINVGGNATNDPNCAKTGVAGRVTYFARGTEMSLWRNQFNGGAWSAAGWSGWLSLGGFHRLTASCAMTTIGQMICGSISGLDSALYTNLVNGATWNGWIKVGGVVFGGPSCTSLNTGKVLCAFNSLSNKISSTVGP
jgi:hypothetical protein